MATENQVKRALERAFGYIPNTLDNVINARNSILGKIEAVNDKVNIVESEVTLRVPKFYGKEE